MNSSRNGISRRDMLRLMGVGTVGTALGSQMAYAQSVPESGTLRFQIESGPGTDFVAVVDAFIAEHPEIDVEFSQIEAMVVGIELAAQCDGGGHCRSDLERESRSSSSLIPILKAGLIQPLDGYRDSV